MSDRLSNIALRFLGTRNTLEELAAIDTTILKSGAMVHVTSVRDYFYVEKDAADAADGTTIVQPVNGPGRWFRMGVSASSAAWDTQATWFVDPVDGSDGNDGATNTTALQTMGELQRRIGAAVINQDTSITLLNDVPNSDFFGFRGALGLTGVLHFFGTPTVLETLVLTGVVSEVPSTATRGSITVGGFDFTPYVGRRVRVTAGANVGIVAWIEALGGAVDTAFVSAPINAPGYFNAPFTIGDTIVIEQLTQIGPVSVSATSADNDDITTGGTILYSDLAFNQLTTGDERFYTNVQSAWFGCDFSMYTIVCPTLGYVVGCRFRSNYLSTLFCSVWSSSCELALIIDCFIDFRTSSSQTNFPLFAYAKSFVGVQAPLAVWDWSITVGVGAGILVSGGSELDMVDQVWGSSAVAGTFGIEIRGDSFGQYALVPTLVGALSPGQDAIVGGTAIAYGALPFLNASNRGALVVRA